MRKLFVLILPVITSMVFLSCSRNVIGTWRIVSYEEAIPGQSATTLTNIGTITFNRNGSGNTDISYNVMGIPMEDKYTFSWSRGEHSLVIERSDSDFAKVWFIVERKGKIMKLRSTDGTNVIHRLTLSR